MNIPFTIESSNILDFADLLPRIPVEITLKTINQKNLTSEEAELIGRIEKASENALTPLPLGISAIGELLAHSADQVEPEVVQNIGWLIEALGRQLFALSHLREHSGSILAHDNKNKVSNEGLMS